MQFSKVLITATLVEAQIEAHHITFRAGSGSFPRNNSMSRHWFHQAELLFTAAALMRMGMGDTAHAMLSQELDEDIREDVIASINRYANKLKESQDSFTDVPWHTPKPAPWED